MWKRQKTEVLVTTPKPWLRRSSTIQEDVWRGQETSRLADFELGDPELSLWTPHL